MMTAIRPLSVLWSLALFLAFAPAFGLQGAETKVATTVIAFGLFGDESVFESEAKGAAQIVASHFGDGPVIVRANTKTREEATPETLAAVGLTHASYVNALVRSKTSA